MKLFPPKKINKYYGYRTELSQSSERAWKLAQEHSMKMNFNYGFMMLAIGAITGYLLVLGKQIFVILAIELLVLMPIFTFSRMGATQKYLKEQLNNRR